MTVDNVVEITRTTLYTIILTSAPMLLISLIIGLSVSIFQTVTSIQEQTLTFVPKLVGIFVMLMILGNWMLNNMVGFMTDLWSDFSLYIK
ncbi:MAG: flagellar biosynthesis protein FliQ [Lachnospiraceae bacterium]|nr:flagellar biosynthesis protein FliQ [Lachnospiraceae bacterium]MBR5765906.1 flagellar biosynthesis protein FliQ [Lachnospiraceae bacterium]MBR6486715.1 flagellar biosynthesis protein FliQ [Lachnospiraceae bacterium]